NDRKSDHGVVELDDRDALRHRMMDERGRGVTIERQIERDGHRQEEPECAAGETAPEGEQDKDGEVEETRGPVRQRVTDIADDEDEGEEHEGTEPLTRCEHGL